MVFPVARTGKNLFSDAESRTKEFSVKFNELKSAFQSHSVLHTELMVVKVLNQVNNMGKILESCKRYVIFCLYYLLLGHDMNMQDMWYSNGAGYNPSKACLDNTRQTAIDQIVEWINCYNEGIPHVFWLHGVAGSGKSAIAHSVAEIFAKQKRLGSFFGFDAGSQIDRQLHHLFSTITCDLADFELQWKIALSNIIGGQRALRTTVSVMQQFEYFLLKPAQALKIVGPVVIVIDALDECGDEQSRKELLSVLAKKLSGLPSNFRIILTSRSEYDFAMAFYNNPDVFCQSMDNIASKEATDHDISEFIKSELASKPSESLEKKWPNGLWCQLLVQKSEQLFQWAATACRFVLETGQLPVKQLEILLTPISSNNQSSLDSLYMSILKQTFKHQDVEFLTRFADVLGVVVALKEPQRISALYKLCFNYETEEVDAILRPLGSLLSGVSGGSLPVQPLHSSFRDFLLSKNKSSMFYVGDAKSDKNLAHACAEIMEDLHFNMCKLSTSYVINENIPNINVLINNNISTQLSYACRFWVEHLQAISYTDDMHQKVQNFLYNQLLYWLEVLSLLGKVRIAFQAIEGIHEWVKVIDTIKWCFPY
jgi:hypothetical protein